MPDKDIIVFDIDGTLSLVGSRIECLQRTPKNWDEFYARCGEDSYNVPIWLLLIQLSQAPGLEIHLVTGRRESCREETQKWIETVDGHRCPDTNLHMRSNDDYRHDTLVKPELVAPFINRIQMVFEDRDSMVKKWRELGITCLQVAEGKF